MIEVLFVAGVHGVGKSTFCSKLNEMSGLSHFSASSLIKNEKNHPVDESKYVKEPGENQDYLIVALENLSESGPIILDGHFCLQLSNEIFDVPLDTFSSMNLKSVMLLTGDINFIETNLINRDGGAFCKNVIAELQEREIRRARYVCEKLGIELMEIDSRKSDAVVDSLPKALGFV